MPWVRGRVPRSKQMKALRISFSALKIHFIHSSFAWYSMKNYIISQYGARTIPLSVINNLLPCYSPLTSASLSARHRKYFDWMVHVTQRSNNIINLFYVRLVVLLAGNRFMMYHLRFMIWPTCLYSTRVLETHFSLYLFAFYSCMEFREMEMCIESIDANTLKLIQSLAEVLRFFAHKYSDRMRRKYSEIMKRERNISYE